MKRCEWVGKDTLYIKYHDEEWGKPVYDDKTLFEFLLLETFQAGLSWLTILKRRENFKKAFDGFDYKMIAEYTDKKQKELMQDKGIIRNRLKIESASKNARAFIKIQEEHNSFSNFFWSYVNGKPIVNNFQSINQVPSSTPLSDRISKDLKKQGFNFVGSTIIYAYMQAIGMVNDHILGCIAR
jgi:DNA-3-methyladenine glycosylase I